MITEVSGEQIWVALLRDDRLEKSQHDTYRDIAMKMPQTLADLLPKIVNMEVLLWAAAKLNFEYLNTVPAKLTVVNFIVLTLLYLWALFGGIVMFLIWLFCFITGLDENFVIEVFGLNMEMERRFKAGNLTVAELLANQPGVIMFHARKRKQK